MMDPADTEAPPVANFSINRLGHSVIGKIVLGKNVVGKNVIRKKHQSMLYEYNAITL